MQNDPFPDNAVFVDRETIIQLRAAAISFVRLADEVLGQAQTIPKRNEAKLRRRTNRRNLERECVGV